MFKQQLRRDFVNTVCAVDFRPSPAPQGGCPNCGFDTWRLPAKLTLHEAAEFNACISHRRPLKRNEHLHHVGSALTSLHVLHSGFLMTRVTDENGREQITGFSMPGELVGLDALSAGRHECETSAVEDSDLCGMPFADLEQLSRAIPELQRHFHRAMGAEIARDYGIMLLLGSLRAEERVALFVLNLSKRFAARGYSELHFRLPMSRQDIGNYLGLTLETVSRVLSRFNESRLLVINGKDLEIKDLVRLQQITGLST
jgi:CRP/FNR family transcriptional regulator